MAQLDAQDQYVLFEDQLHGFILRDNNRDTIDAWANTIMSTLKSWPPYLPVVVLLELGDHDVMLTPYLRASMDRVMGQLALLKGRFALRIANTLNGQMIRLNHHRYYDPHRTMRSRIFQEKEDAIKWLKGGFI